METKEYKNNKKENSKQANEATQQNPQPTPPKEEKPSEIIQQKEKYLQLYAEFENYKKRTAKEKNTWITIAKERIITSLLPILEDLERALESLQTTKAKETDLKEGMKLIHQKFEKKMQENGLTIMQTSFNDTFNTDYHEAIQQIPTEDPTLKGKIVKVVTKGYLLDNKVIQTAKVTVAA